MPISAAKSIRITKEQEHELTKGINVTLLVGAELYDVPIREDGVVIAYIPNTGYRVWISPLNYEVI